MKKEIISSIKRNFYKVAFELRKHSPEILVVSGVIGGVVSAVIACKATTKAGDILEQTKENVDAIHEKEKENEGIEEYSEQDVKKELTAVYIRAGAKFVKLYAPAVLLGTVSVVSILASTNILRKRNVALTAAYAVVDKSFKEYRNRVVERFGDSVDYELKHNVKTREIEETIEDENGKKKKTKKMVEVCGDVPSEYARFFDESSRMWEKDSEYNLLFLRSEQNYANDLLKSRGYLFLNEVYERLDIDTTRAGQIVGWIYDPSDPTRSNYVDFGIYDVNRERARAFVNGFERSILLDFNVDGPILNKAFK